MALVRKSGVIAARAQKESLAVVRETKARSVRLALDVSCPHNAHQTSNAPGMLPEEIERKFGGLRM